MDFYLIASSRPFAHGQITWYYGHCFAVFIYLFVITCLDSDKGFRTGLFSTSINTSRTSINTSGLR